MATSEGTWEYREEFGAEFARTFYRSYGDLVVASIGLGTYLGSPTDETDSEYRTVAVTALESGVNVLDTAINYRHQRSERVLGEAIREASPDREAIFVATKGGFIPFDETAPTDPSGVVRETYIDSGLVRPSDLARGQHSLSPEFLSDQLDRSLSNMDLDTIDLYYVHNPETQLSVRSREDVYDQLESAFELLENRVVLGDISSYGVASWEAFRVPFDHEAYLSLSTIVDRARAAAQTAGNDECHLTAIQLPFNVEMAGAYTIQAQGSDRNRSTLTVAADERLAVFTSASLKQGKLANGIPDGIADRLAGRSSPQRAINFARSAPGVTTALVGSTSPTHMLENVDAGTYDPLGARAFDEIFE